VQGNDKWIGYHFVGMKITLRKEIATGWSKNISKFCEAMDRPNSMPNSHTKMVWTSVMPGFKKLSLCKPFGCNPSAQYDYQYSTRLSYPQFISLVYVVIKQKSHKAVKPCPM